MDANKENDPVFSNLTTVWAYTIAFLFFGSALALVLTPTIITALFIARMF